MRGFNEREKLARPTYDVPLADLAAAWQAHTVARRRPRTWESYALGLRDVLAWLRKQGKAPVLARDIALADVRAYATAKLGQGLAARSVSMRVATLRAMLRWGVREGLLGSNPLEAWRPIAGPKVRQRRALGEVEIVQLLNASPEPYRSAWVVFLGTGLRGGELVALTWGDVDFEAGTLTVQAETSKSKRTRIVPLRDDVAAVLRRVRLDVPRRLAVARHRVELAESLVKRAEGREAREAARKRLREAQAAVETAGHLVFVNGGGGSWGMALSRRLKPCLRAAGLPESLDLHCLRHTFGSHLVAGGADIKSVQELLGHSSAIVTLDVYAHAFTGRKREAVELVPLPVMGGSGAVACAPGAPGAREAAGA